MSNKEKFLNLVSKEKSNTLDEIQWRKENRDWLRKSQGIAFKILKALRDQKITQKELAIKLDVSPQQVNKWVKGKENFRLDTISKLETALGLDLVTVQDKKPEPMDEAVKIIHMTYDDYIKVSTGIRTTKSRKSQVFSICKENTWYSTEEYAY